MKRNKRNLLIRKKIEFEQLETEIEKLTEEKSSIEELLNSGTLSPDELVNKSNRIGEIMNILDEKEFRWLELSEKNLNLVSHSSCSLYFFNIPI